MRKVLKWIAIVAGGLLGLFIIAGAVLAIMGNSRLGQKFDIPVEDFVIPDSDETIARGRHLSEAITLCQGCHGDKLEGTIIDDEPGVATITASNLTTGRGGVARDYSDADWVRAIRHGVNPAGRGLILMHSDKYNSLTEEDLGAIIAFVKSSPAVDNELPETNAGILGKVMVALGMFDSEAMPLIPAELIDHDVSIPEKIPEAETAEYGQYLTSITVCAMCHGTDFKGGSPLEPGAPAAPDVTQTGELKGVSVEAFIDHFRSHADEDDEYMPWDMFARMTDVELTAIWKYLVSLDVSG